LHYLLGSSHALDEVCRCVLAPGRENAGDAIGSTFALAMKGLKTYKLTDVEHGMHDTLLEAGAGSTSHYNPEVERSLFIS
jgi:hypothetical protein